MNNQRVLEILHDAKALAREYYQLTGGERLGGPSATFRPPDIPLEKLAAFPRSQAAATANRIWSVVPGNTAFLALSVSQRAATARVRCGELSGASVMRSS